MAIFSLSEPLFPLIFADKRLYKSLPRVPLYSALASTAQFLLFPKAPVNTARCDVPRFFAARYFSDDEQPAVKEFEYRWPGMKVRLWKGIVTLKQCIDLSDETVIARLQLGPGFLMEDPYFPWHFITACALTADCDSVCYGSFRGTGRNYALFDLADASILEPFQPI
jgi:hypothetical protein